MKLKKYVFITRHIKAMSLRLVADFLKCLLYQNHDWVTLDASSVLAIKEVPRKVIFENY